VVVSRPDVVQFEVS